MTSKAPTRRARVWAYMRDEATIRVLPLAAATALHAPSQKKSKKRRSLRFLHLHTPAGRWPPVQKRRVGASRGRWSPGNVLSSLEQLSPTASRLNSSTSSLMFVSVQETRTRWTRGAGGQQWLKRRNQAIQHNLLSICIWEKSNKCQAMQRAAALDFWGINRY
jgi:hypothetical protein